MLTAKPYPADCYNVRINGQPCITAKEYAEKNNLKLRTVYRHAKQGNLTSIKVGGFLFIKEV